MNKYLLTLFGMFLLSPIFAFASSVVIEVDIGKEIINAIEGTVVLPNDVVVDQIQTGNSAILFWVSQPLYDKDSNTITFAGLIPGGVSGKRPVLSIVGDLSSSQINKITFNGVRALKNDGNGSQTKVTLRALMTSVIEDTTKPESFEIILSRSEDVFNNNLFASFATQDKLSGVDRFEISERLILAPNSEDWVQGVSPYEIRDRWLIKKIYIKAIDKNGNSIVISQALSNRKYLVLLLAIIFGVLCAIFFKRSRR